MPSRRRDGAVGIGRRAGGVRPYKMKTGNSAVRADVGIGPYGGHGILCRPGSGRPGGRPLRNYDKKYGDKSKTGG